MKLRNTIGILVCALAVCCGAPQPDPLNGEEIPWDELFPPVDTIEADVVENDGMGSDGVDVPTWPPEGVEPVTNSCAVGETRRVGGTVFYDGPEVPPGAALYLLMDSEPIPPPGIPECFMGVQNPEFPVVFEFQEVWDGEPRYAMALLKWEGGFPPVPGPEDWFARIPTDGPLPMDADEFWLELQLAPYEEE